MHSHHSHSGQYVAHATNTLDEMIQAAIARDFDIFCLTEHMPRLYDENIYPEEIELNYDVSRLNEIFQNYYNHSVALQQKINSDDTIKTKILVGFEIEGIDENHFNLSNEIFTKNEKFNMTVGSIHFVNKIPIDFNQEYWDLAKKSCNNSTYELFKSYFNLQYQLLQICKPNIVGHFDLIYLFSPANEGPKSENFSIENNWPKIWSLIIRNIKFIKEYGGLIELNSAALRKGWLTPYPNLEISLAIKKYGDSRFCFSDDSHSIAQVGLNYHKLLNYIQNSLKLDKIYYLDLDSDNETIVKTASIDDIKSNEKFWKNYN
ncbi:histidinol-phosphatase [Ascoidea rubescens DSM 1968]|uniref:Histidinol-phosphatase n=1 Tax=Ascoidea rubescens DSM 1968 TaxID=1344418 RepID=A0A1D2VID0_9ASCO|nr:histidinol phosphate phosphatase H [Ascoidea rubescens DSM 1968]ODV61243.1 histidinol phosphate phosphatase H [Ascoidea rubescens DSM 1968]